MPTTPEFEHLRRQLADRLDAVALPEDESQYAWFCKLDISGIQEFVFHVQSEKAARSLKGRSFFVHAVGLLAERWLRDRQKHAPPFTLYNGGGNAYLLLATDAGVDTLQAELNEALHRLPLTACLSRVPYAGNFSAAKKLLEEASAKDKLRKFNNYHAAFAPFAGILPSQAPDHWQQHWDDFTRNLIRRKAYRIGPKPPGGDEAVDKPELKLGYKVEPGYLSLLGYHLTLTTDVVRDTDATQAGNLRESILANLPVWPEDWLRDGAGDAPRQLVDLVNEDYRRQDTRLRNGNLKTVNPGDVIEFLALAAQAGQRTGTPKLGILKMDVDNLGKVFEDLPSLAIATRLSSAYSWFFDTFFYQLWDGEYQFENYWKGAGNAVQTCAIRDNLYVVFAGGDDCFMVGAWDVVLDFASKLRRAFGHFVIAVNQLIPELGRPNTTLSAGISLVGPKFPTIRFATMAEDALTAAKSYGDKQKNRITLFEEELDWEAYRRTRAVAVQVASYVRDGLVKRSLPQRLIQSGKGLDNLVQRVQEDRLRLPYVWRLQYFVGKQTKGKSVPAQAAREEIKQLLEDYAEALLEAFYAKAGTDHMAYPLAGRLAEFITKKAKLTGHE